MLWSCHTLWYDLAACCAEVLRCAEALLSTVLLSCCAVTLTTLSMLQSMLQILNLEGQLKGLHKAHEASKLNLTQAVEACNFATKKRRAAERQLAKLQVRSSSLTISKKCTSELQEALSCSAVARQWCSSANKRKRVLCHAYQSTCWSYCAYAHVIYRSCLPGRCFKSCTDTITVYLAVPVCLVCLSLSVSLCLSDGACVMRLSRRHHRKVAVLSQRAAPWATA